MPAGMTTGLTADGFKKLVLNAGAFVAGFDPSTYTSVAALKAALADVITDSTKNLGMTRGGGTFTVTREMRQVEADGIRYRFVGDTFVDSSDAYLSTTLIGVGDPNIMKNAIGTATVSASGNKKLLRMKTRIEESDYIDDLCWIGDIADGGLILIHLLHAFNTADLAITMTDKGELTLPVEFHAYQSEVEDYDYAPYEIIYLDNPEGNSAAYTVTYTEVTAEAKAETGVNPSTEGWFEKDDGVYVVTDDTSVSDQDKTYYIATYD